MNKKLNLFVYACSLSGIMFGQQIKELKHLSSYNTNGADAAEVVAYDETHKQICFTSSALNKLTFLNAANPSDLTLLKEIDLSVYGGGPNSLDIHDGLVAVAVQGNIVTDSGSVVFFDHTGLFLKKVKVGHLPDMLTFTKDGSKVLVANEGEPNTEYTIDPEGSISVIDLSNGVSNASSTSITFESYNDKKVHLQNKGIRIFGNNGNATVAQDLEPEYITVTPNGKLAYISCQENNALVVLDLATLKILDILPLGYKNHASGSPEINLININEKVANWPSIGTPEYLGGQQPVMLGGFSGLHFSEKESSTTEYVFYTVPDRGPNEEAITKSTVTPVAKQNIRPFKLPDYQSRIVKFTVNTVTGDVTLNNQIMLTRKDASTPISGKGNILGIDEVPVTYTDKNTNFSDTTYKDTQGKAFTELPYDEFGGDFEGILKDKNGDFWLCDEYRPAIYQFNTSGVLKNRYVPVGTAQLGTNPKTTGTYGEETLPAVYSKRWANRGFEAIAYDSTKHVIYAFIQSPLYNPNSQTKDNSDVIRILGVNAATGEPVSEYVYLLERNKYAGYSSDRVDKIGDAVYTGNNTFLVIERDSEGPTVTEGKKLVFEINLIGATNILNLPLSAGTLELNSADELANLGIKAVHKTKVLNLPSVGYLGSDKTEGIAVLPNNKIAIMNDNDFGLAGAGITDNSVLGVISFQDNYGFDASDKDNKINITSHPTLGMLLPDGISSYEVNGKTYIVTANEGDSRDYAGYSEEKRVKDLVLDPTAYPNAADLQKDDQLGRLKTTSATGDYDNDGDIDQIYSFGARSFSIFDEFGNLVYDSGNGLETKSSTTEPDFFNEDAGKKDGRSDDKGVEPEAISIGTIGNYTYAFVGCERNSTIYVYDITDPKTPSFVTYYNNRTIGSADAAPEIIKFIPASKSPNGENLLLVGYEVSGSVGVVQIDGTLLGNISTENELASFTIFPNPVSKGDIQLNENLSGQILNAQGMLIKTFENTNRISVSDLEEGIYIISTTEKGNKRFLKL